MNSLKSLLSLYYILSLGLPAPFLPLAGQANVEREVRFRIQPESQLYLEGSSNLKGFHCLSTERFGEQVALISSHGEVWGVHTELAIAIENMDCGNPGINRDMRSALQEPSHPYIQIQVLEVSGMTLEPAGAAWQSVAARVAVHIAGQRQELSIPIQFRQHQAGLLRLQGHCPLKMTHFGIEPPTALFGLVKVADEIEIFFDLWVETLE